MTSPRKAFIIKFPSKEWNFADVANINVRGGKGGDGCMAMLREHKAPLGGPAGGDGGPGGAVVLRADDSLHSLESVRRRVHYKGEDGGNGQGKGRHGSRGGSCVISVST